MEKAGAQELFYINCIENIESATDAYQMINEAWPFMEYIFPNNKCFTKFELALAGNCINISLKGGIIKKYYMDLLSPLRKPGDNKGRQLLETLETFVLDAGMKTSATARIMTLHSNTIQYRLKKIKEMLGVDIMDATVIPGLIIALALERIEKVVKVL
jgi:DNA-binding PucR family transcriptional regulator